MTQTSTSTASAFPKPLRYASQTTKFSGTMPRFGNETRPAAPGGPGGEDMKDEFAPKPNAAVAPPHPETPAAAPLHPATEAEHLAAVKPAESLAESGVKPLTAQVVQAVQKKGVGFWLKSGLLSLPGLALFGAGVGCLTIPGGFILSTGLLLAGLMLHDFTMQTARQKGYLNVSDPQYLQKMMLQYGENPLRKLAKLRYPMSPAKQNYLVYNILSRVQNINVQRMLARTGLNYEAVLSKMRNESSYLAKTAIMTRFLMTVALKQNLVRLMLRKGRFVAWMVPLLWSVIAGKEHGRLEEHLPPGGLVSQQAFPRPVMRPQAYPYSEYPEKQAG